jgi:hypothetical protein
MVRCEFCGKLTHSTAKGCIVGANTCPTCLAEQVAETERQNGDVAPDEAKQGQREKVKR